MIHKQETVANRMWHTNSPTASFYNRLFVLHSKNSVPGNFLRGDESREEKIPVMVMLTVFLFCLCALNVWGLNKSSLNKFPVNFKQKIVEKLINYGM